METATMAEREQNTRIARLAPTVPIAQAGFCHGRLHPYPLRLHQSLPRRQPTAAAATAAAGRPLPLAVGRRWRPPPAIFSRAAGGGRTRRQNQRPVPLKPGRAPRGAFEESYYLYL